MTSRDLAKIATGRLVADTARDLFARHGYEAVTMRMIAKAAGKSTGAIFENYAGKEALFEACMGRPAPDVLEFLRYVEQGKFDYQSGNDGAEAKLDEMAHAAVRLLRDLVGAT